MKRFTAIALALAIVGFAVMASAATEVKMVGDARIWGNWTSDMNYTGWNSTGTKTAQSLTIYERFRLRTDFVANEGLKFRFGIRVNNKAWGDAAATTAAAGGGFLIDNPAVNIDVYECYLQFKWPNTEIQFTIGMQPLDLPISADMLYGNPVLGVTWGPAAIVNAPFTDNFGAVAGFIRFADGNPGFEPSTTVLADRLDGYLLALPITFDGFKAVPWGVLGVMGHDAAAVAKSIGTGASPRINNQNVGNGMLSSSAYLNPAVMLRQAEQVYYWVGTTLTVTALDPFKFYGDIIYGADGTSDKKYDKRGGLWFDVAAEYTGFDMLTPQATFWYGTGDTSAHQGSQRMPTIVDNWGPSTSFLFNTSQALAAGYAAGLNPAGSWGVAVSLDKITFVQDLKSRITFTFANGTNSNNALRYGNLLNGVGTYYQMGRDLSKDEYVYGVNFDNQYNIYENLAAIVETGWAHGNFETSVWTHRFTNAAKNGDEWKVAFGLQYKF